MAEPKRQSKEPTPKKQSLVEQIEAMPPPALGVDASDSRRSFGLPEEALAEQWPGFVPFVQGDEYTPQRLSPADRLRYQRIMVGAGLLSESDYSPGVWDPRSARAYGDVLSLANSMGTRDVEAALGEYATQAQTYGTKPKRPRQPLTVSYANPESVRQVVRDSSFKMLGKRLSDLDEAALVQAYQGHSRAAQAAEHAAAGEGGGAFTGPMSVSDFAAQQLENRPEAAAQRYLQGFEKAMEVLTGTVVPVPRGL